MRGWVRTRRDAKAVSFLEINDGSRLSGLQVVVEEALRDQLEGVATGVSVIAHGILRESPGGRQAVELAADSVSLVGPAPAESYPLQKKRHSFEFLREIAHLRPRTNTFGAVARVRNALSMAVHQFFQERGYLWVHTPIITASDAEGAGAMFRVEASPAPEEGFFGKPAFLTVSGQLNVETYASALERVYTFGPTFRAENSNTTRHLAEFWMIEPEAAWMDLDGLIALAGDFLRFQVAAVLSSCEEDMAFFDQRIEPGLLASLQALLDRPTQRITYTDAVAELQKATVDFAFTPEWGADLQSEHERYLTETVFGGPVAVTDYPVGLKAFYMYANDDGRTVRATDLLVPRLGEIIGGSQREHRLDVLERRITELGLDPEVYWWYLDLRRYGTVPHSGFGVGFERVVQYVTGMQNIRDVIPFPRSAGSAIF